VKALKLRRSGFSVLFKMAKPRSLFFGSQKAKGEQNAEFLLDSEH
jgi:hypothetical protein